MERPHACRHGHRGRVRVRGGKLSVFDEDRPKNHRSTLVGAALLWAACGRASGHGAARWLKRKGRRGGLPKRHAARFTPENPPKKAWSRLLIRLMRSAKPAPPSFS